MAASLNELSYKFKVSKSKYTVTCKTSMHNCFVNYLGTVTKPIDF
jgi:hypothetical protein